MVSKPQGPAPSPVLLAKLSEHLALAGTILSAFLVAARILSVGGYDPETAFGLLQAAGTGAVILGTLLGLIGLVPVYVGILSMLNYEQIALQVGRPVCIGAIIFSFLVAIWFGPVLGVVMLAGVGVFLLWYRGATRRLQVKYGDGTPDRDDLPEVDRYKAVIRQLEIEGPKRSVSLQPVIFVVLFIVGIVLNTQPWMPPEDLTIAGAAPITAYVLSAGPDYTAVMTASPPEIKYIRTASITRRRLCVLGSGGIVWRSLPELTAPARYPSCSTLAKSHSAG